MNISLSTPSLKIVITIDYILKSLRYKYDKDSKITIRGEDKNIPEEELYYMPDDESLDILRKEKLTIVHWKKRDVYYEDEYRGTLYDTTISCINTLELYEYKRKLLWKSQKSIINSWTLERIAKWIWDAGNADSIIKVLKECGVPDYLIIYPNTKWRMVDDLFRVLATSIYEEWHNLLFSIIEEFLNPIRCWSIESGIETQKYYSEYLTYDGYEILKGKIVPIQDKRDMYDVYYESRTGKRIEIEEYDTIKDAISNTEYKKVTLIKWKDGQIERIDGERHILSDGDTKFVQIKNAFPHSDISASVYEGNINKYIVTEKIKMDKSE